MDLSIPVTQTQNQLGKYNKLDQMKVTPLLSRLPPTPAWSAWIEGPSSHLLTPGQGAPTPCAGLSWP